MIDARKNVEILSKLRALAGSVVKVSSLRIFNPPIDSTQAAVLLTAQMFSEAADCDRFLLLFLGSDGRLFDILAGPVAMKAFVFSSKASLDRVNLELL